MTKEKQIEMLEEKVKELEGENSKLFIEYNLLNLKMKSTIKDINKDYVERIREITTEYGEENKELKVEIEELNDDIEWWQNRFNAVERDNEQLKKQKDDVVEYIKKNKYKQYSGRNEFTCEIQYSDYVIKADDLLRMLGEIDE